MIKKFLKQKKAIKQVKDMLKTKKYKDININKSLFTALVTLFKDDYKPQDINRLLMEHGHILVNGVWKPKQ